MAKISFHLAKFGCGKYRAFLARFDGISVSFDLVMGVLAYLSLGKTERSLYVPPKSPKMVRFGISTQIFIRTVR